MPDAAQNRAADAKRTPGAIQARFGGFCWIRLGLIWLGRAGQPNKVKQGRVHPGKAGPAACLLLNREQIQGPKNAPIARFDGLCCYRSGSEKRWLAAGGRRLRKPLLDRRDARHTGEVSRAFALQAARETVLRVALMPDVAQSRAADAKRTPGAIQARFGGFCWIRLGLIWLG